MLKISMFCGFKKTLLLYNFQDGMGKLRITDQGLKHYGEAEFVDELRANLIRPSQVRYYVHTCIIV